MPEKKNKNKSGKKNRVSALPGQAVSTYQEGADPLGSYTGITSDSIFPGRSVPRSHLGGKTYMHVDGQPVQDADDL